MSRYRAFLESDFVLAAEVEQLLQDEYKVVERHGESVPAVVGAQTLGEEVVARDFPIEVFLVFGTVPVFHKFLSGVAVEEVVDVVLVFQWKIHTRQQVVIGVFTVCGSCFQQGKFGFDQADVTPIQLDGIGDDVELGSAQFVMMHAFSQVARAPVDVEVDVVTLIVEHRQQGPQHGVLIVCDD